MECSEKIAKNLNLSEEDVTLAKMIGLLHDIARFRQYSEYQTFDDKKSFDHGDVGVDILKDNNFIRDFIEEDIYDGIIFKAIRNHNKYMIEDGLSERELLFAKIIKDADKWDILYETTYFFWSSDEDKRKIEECTVITKELLEGFREHKAISYKYKITPLDYVIFYAAFCFDFYFKYTLEEIKKEEYINKMFDRFDYKDSEIKEQISKIKNIVNNYEMN